MARILVDAIRPSGLVGKVPVDMCGVMNRLGLLELATSRSPLMQLSLATLHLVDHDEAQNHELFDSPTVDGKPRIVSVARGDAVTIGPVRFN